MIYRKTNPLVELYHDEYGVRVAASYILNPVCDDERLCVASAGNMFTTQSRL